jgi:drug/metabolite transporter (DMT)-like permease
MAEVRSQHRLGIALVVAAAIAWSTAPFFTRLLPYDSWTILFWRGLFAGGMIMVLMVLLQGRAGLRDLIRMRKSGWLVASLSAAAMIAFIPSLQLTGVANVAIIIATGPFVTAALAWVWLREVPHLRTMLASIVALCGVMIIVGNARAGSDILGIALACFMALANAAMTVMVRRHKNTSMVSAAAMSNILSSLISIPFAHGIADITGFDLFIVAMFGCFQVSLGLTLFFLGSRLLPSGQAALISTLETPLMPFWIWVAFAEVPTAGSRRRRPGDGRRHCRHHRRYQDAAAIRLIRPNDLPRAASAALPRESDDLDPVRVLADRIFLQLGELAGRLVDRVTRHAVGQLADGQQIAAGRINAEAARLLFGRIGIDRRQ